MPDAVVRFENVSKSFARAKALDSLSLSIAASQIVGLVGTNGSGKSTLLRHIIGMYLPSKGECFTFGVPARNLGSAELARIGMVHQREDFLAWMSVGELLGYVGSFYRTWDKGIQNRFVAEFELDTGTRVDHLAPGKKQRLAILLAICHRPDLLLFDEPLSDLDPLARDKILMLILDVFRDSAPTIVVSSHLLHDIERIIDHVICLDGGKVVLNEPLDRLKERFAEWTVLSMNGRLPARFSEPWIVSQSGDDARRLLVVSDSPSHLADFSSTYGVRVESRPLNLEKVFTHVVGPMHAPRQRP